MQLADTVKQCLSLVFVKIGRLTGVQKRTVPPTALETKRIEVLSDVVIPPYDPVNLDQQER